MLIGLDEFPFHQIVESFAGAATGDPSWNDGHYFGVTDHAGNVSLTASLRLYPNNDVMDGFVCLRHRDRQYNVRVSRRLRPEIDVLRVGPLGLEIVEPMQQVRLVARAERRRRQPRPAVHAARRVPARSPVETHARRRPPGQRAHDVRDHRRRARASSRSRGSATSSTDDSASFFRNHSWGMHPGRGGPRPYAAPGSTKRRVPGVRQWVLFHMPDHGGHFFVDPSGRRASGRGVLMYADRLVDVIDVEHDLTFYEGDRRLSGGTLRAHRRRGRPPRLRIEDLGWVYCQGGGYFGGWDDGLGQGVYRGDVYVEGEVWDVSHPTTVVDADGKEIEFDHDWAESFVRLTGPSGTGCRALRVRRDPGGRVVEQLSGAGCRPRPRSRDRDRARCATRRTSKDWDGRGGVLRRGRGLHPPRRPGRGRRRDRRPDRRRRSQALDASQHLIGSITVDVDGDTARVAVPTSRPSTCAPARPGGDLYTIAGTYADRWVRTPRRVADRRADPDLPLAQRQPRRHRPLSHSPRHTQREGVRRGPEQPHRARHRRQPRTGRHARRGRPRPRRRQGVRRRSRPRLTGCGRRAGGGRVVPVRLDVTSPDQVAAAAEDGDVDLVISNAGITCQVPILGRAGHRATSGARWRSTTSAP